MSVVLAPIPENITLPAEQSEALLKQERYSRKGELNPPLMVTRQQFIEDILAQGFTELKRSHDPRNGRVVAVSVARGEGKGRQFYTLNRRFEMEYLLLRHGQVMEMQGKAQVEEGRRQVSARGNGWQFGEVVTQQLTHLDGRTYTITGEVTINSAQRWRVRITNTDGAPSLRVGQNFPVTESWRRKSTVATAAIPVVAPSVAPIPVVPEAKSAEAATPAAGVEQMDAQLNRSGVAYVDGVRYAIAPIPARMTGYVAPNDAAWTVEITRNGQVAALPIAVSMEGARKRAAQEAYPQRAAIGAPEVPGEAPAPTPGGETEATPTVEESTKTPLPAIGTVVQWEPPVGGLVIGRVVEVKSVNEPMRVRVTSTEGVAGQRYPRGATLPLTGEWRMQAPDMAAVPPAPEPVPLTAEPPMDFIYEFTEPQSRALAATPVGVEAVLLAGLLRNPRVADLARRTEPGTTVESMAELIAVLRIECPRAVAALETRVAGWSAPQSYPLTALDSYRFLLPPGGPMDFGVARSICDAVRHPERQAQPTLAPEAPAPVVSVSEPWAPNNPEDVFRYEPAADGSARWVLVKGEVFTHPELPGMRFALVSDASPDVSNWVAVLETSSGQKLVWEATVETVRSSFDKLVQQLTPDGVRRSVAEIVAARGRAPVAPVPEAAPTPVDTAPSVAPVPAPTPLAAEPAVVRPATLTLSDYRFRVRRGDLHCEIPGGYLAAMDSAAFIEGERAVWREEATPEVRESRTSQMRSQFALGTFTAHQASVATALDAGQALPEAVVREFHSFSRDNAASAAIVASWPGSVPCANEYAESGAQALTELKRKSDAESPYVGEMAPAERAAYLASQLASSRVLYQKLADAILGKTEIVNTRGFLHRGNPGVMRLLFDLTRWKDRTISEKNAVACYEAWIGKETLESTLKAARDMQAAAEARKRLDHVVRVLESQRRRYVPMGQTEPKEMNSRELIDLLVAEGHRVLGRAKMREARGGWVFAKPDASRGVVLRSQEERDYAEHAVQQAKAKEAPAQVAAPAVDAAPAVQPVLAPVPEEKAAPFSPSPAPEKPAKPAGVPGGVTAYVLSSETGYHFRRADTQDPVDTPVVAEAAPTPLSPVEVALAAGAKPVDRQTPALSLIDWHTATGTVRMVVAGPAGEGSAVTAFHADQYLSGEPVSSVSVPVAEATLPAKDSRLDRAPGVFREQITRLASGVARSLPAEDPVAERLFALATAATNAKDAEVVAILAEPAVALAIGEPTTLLASEAAQVQAKTVKVDDPNAANFYFARGENVAPRSIDARTKANLAAIKLLNRLGEEERLATPDEKRVLAGFSGWGSMKGIFDDDMAKFDRTARDHFARTKGEIHYRKDADGVREMVDKEEPYNSRSYGFGTSSTPSTAEVERFDDFDAWLVRYAKLLNEAKTHPESFNHAQVEMRGNPDAEDNKYNLKYGERKYGVTGEEIEKLVSWTANWRDYRVELESGLSEKEFQYAAVSSLNAHFTDEGVCHRLWDIARRVGFKGGVVLEPAIGSGRIIEAMPADFRDRCTVVAVEKDIFTAKLSQALLPEVKVWADPFEHSPIKPNSADLVIANVPFSDIEVGDSGLNLHNFFIKHSMEKLKPGGLAVIITTANTLDKSPNERKVLAAETELVEAFRLPNDAFKATAGTDVVTDILVFRRPSTTLTPTGELFKATLPVEVPVGERPELTEDDKSAGIREPAKVALINEYFHRHPDRALGTHSLLGSMYRKSGADGQYTLVSPKGSAPLLDRLDEAIKTVVEIENSTTPVVASTEAEQAEKRLEALKEDAIGKIVEREGQLWRVGEYRELLPLQPNPSAKLSPAQSELAVQMAGAYVRVRDAFVEQITADLSAATTDEHSATLRKQLRSAYEEYREAFGPLNDEKSAKLLKAVCATDTNLYSVLALEDVAIERKNGKRVKVCTASRILSQRTLFPVSAPDRAEGLEDACAISMAEKMRLDMGYIARLLGRDLVTGPDEVRNELIAQQLAFRDPKTGEAIHRNEYLTGDIYTKLESARKLAAEDPEYAANVTALETALPRMKIFEELGYTLASPWLPHAVLTTFFRRLGLPKEATIVFDPEKGWLPSDATGNERDWEKFFKEYYGAKDAAANYNVLGEGGVIDAHFTDVFRCALSGKKDPIIEETGTGKKVVNQTATFSLGSKVDELNKSFHEWLNEEAQARLRPAMEQAYNSRHNRVVAPTWDGAKLRLPGLSNYKPMDHQRNAVQRGLMTRRGLVGHGVGFGKTLEIIVTAHEMKRIGLSRKPLIVCDSANYEQFVAEAHKCYPTARILHGEEGCMSPTNREQFKGQIASGDYDLILVSREQFGLMQLSPERQIAFLEAELAGEEGVDADNETTSKKASAQAKRKAKLLQKALDKLDALRKSGIGMTFEQMGIDQIFVDESHRHKKIGLKTRFEWKGIDTGVSSRGRDLYYKARFLQELLGQGRGVIGYTGTPVSNTAAELHTAAQIFDPPALESFGVKTFDQFVTTFCETTNELELNEANGRWRYVERLAKYTNFNDFQRFLHSFADIRMDSAELGIKKPDHEKGGHELATCPLSRLVWKGQQLVGGIFDVWDKLIENAGSDSDARKEAFKEKMEMAWIQLALMQINSSVAIDPRLVDPKSKVGKDALIYGVADEIARIYHEKNKTKKVGEITHAQVVFCDRIQSSADRLFEIDLHSGRNQDADDLYAAARVKWCERHGLDADYTLPAGSDDDDDEEETLTDEIKKAAQQAGVEAADTPATGQRFNLWEELRSALVERGIPREQVALISDAKSKREKREIYERMNAGELAVTIGSSDKMGVGANMQKRLYAAHHIDPCRSMTPDGMEQRDGRIERQGNTHSKIRNIRYGMADTVMPAIYGRINYKAAMAKQVYAKPGAELEFKESNDVGAEAMRAALLTDSRARDCALLETEIRELRVRIDAVSAERDLRRRRLESKQGEALAAESRLSQAKRIAEWFESNTAAQCADGQWSLRFKFRYAPTPWDDAIVRKAGLQFNPAHTEIQMRADGDAVRKFLEKLVEGWRETETARPLGVLEINGLPVSLSMERQAGWRDSLTSSDKWGVCGRMLDPLNPIEKEDKTTRYFASFSNCLTGAGLIREYGNIHYNCASTLRYAEDTLARQRAELQALEVAEAKASNAASTVKEDEARIAELQAKVRELKADMQARPFAGRIPEPNAKAGKCELAFSVPAVEAKKAAEAKLAAGRKRSDPVPEQATEPKSMPARRR